MGNLKAFKILLQPGDLLSISSYSLKIRSRLVTDLLFPYLQDHDFFAKRFSINEFQISQRKIQPFFLFMLILLVLFFSFRVKECFWFLK